MQKLNNMAIRALGENYFENYGFPINVCKVDRNENLTHEFDLTEAEHSHDFTEVVFIVKGRGVQVIEEQEYPVSAGDVFVLQGNQKHFFKDPKGIEIINIMYHEDKKAKIVSEIIRQLPGYKALFILESQYRATHHFKNKLHLDRSNIAKLEMVLNVMLSEQEHKKDGFKKIISNRLEELIIILSRHYSSLDATEAKSLIRIGKVIDYLEENYSNKIYLDEMAELSFMSTRNFQRIFKKAVGSSPTSYLQEIRLQKARKLLRESNTSVTNIAIETGFGDSNYLIKCFKKSTGVTPVQFRMRYASVSQVKQKE